MRTNRALVSNRNLFTLLCAVLATIAFTLIVGLGAAQEKTVKNVPIKYTDPGSAKEMYIAYCAVCHGVDGKGDGPAASEFKRPPTDLTMLAKNSDGKYPSEHVYSILRLGTSGAPAHGDTRMPIWNDLFRSVDGSDNVASMRMHNLVQYIQSIQAK